MCSFPSHLSFHDISACRWMCRRTWPPQIYRFLIPSFPPDQCVMFLSAYDLPSRSVSQPQMRSPPSPQPSRRVLAQRRRRERERALRSHNVNVDIHPLPPSHHRCQRSTTPSRWTPAQHQRRQRERVDATTTNLLTQHVSHPATLT